MLAEQNKLLVSFGMQLAAVFSVAVGTACWQARQHIVQRCKRFFQFFCQLLHVELETVPTHLNTQQAELLR